MVKSGKNYHVLCSFLLCILVKSDKKKYLSFCAYMCLYDLTTIFRPRKVQRNKVKFGKNNMYCIYCIYSDLAI